MITRNEVFDKVYTAVLSQYPAAYVASKFEPVPSEFPAVFVREIGNFSTPKAMTFSGSQGVKDSTFEVQIFSNKTDAPSEEAYAISEIIVSVFTSMYYRCDSLKPIDDSNGIFRLAATFRRLLGAADTLPT